MFLKHQNLTNQQKKMPMQLKFWKKGSSIRLNAARLFRIVHALNRKKTIKYMVCTSRQRRNVVLDFYKSVIEHHRSIPKKTCYPIYVDKKDLRETGITQHKNQWNKINLLCKNLKKVNDNKKYFINYQKEI